MAATPHNRVVLAGIALLCAVPVGLFYLGTSALDGKAPPSKRAQPLEVEAPLDVALEGPKLPNPPSTAQAVERVEARREPETNPAEEELSITEELRRLEFSNPRQSLELAQSAIHRFPDGPTVAERSWYQARALVELGRFDEAREVATWMREHQPESPFTADAARHLLSHPFGLPPR